MAPLTESDRVELIRLLNSGQPIPPQWQSRLFGSAQSTGEGGKEYRLVYDGKLKREEILARTPAAPWELVREFGRKRSDKSSWHNLLVWGDNLLALRELLADQQGPDQYGTRGRIRLVYIDPPFATRQDFMKDREKAYRDKVIGAQFIEFLRRRLVLLRELLAEDGSIYVHLDTKKGHYIKAVMDEVFGEEHFRNEIIWKRSAAHSDSSSFSNIHDSILLYSKSDTVLFKPQYVTYEQKYAAERYKHVDAEGRRFMDDNLTAMGLRGGGYDYEWKGIRRIWRCPITTMQRYEKENRIYYTRNGVPRIKRYLDEAKGLALQDVWSDIFPVNSQAAERVDYPTQKPESLLERIIMSSTAEDDIVLDSFAGSGTTAAVAEKLGRRWIAMDSGKLAIYTTQKRLFSLTTSVGTIRTDVRPETHRVPDWAEHLKGAPGILLITEKAREGECEVSIELLQDLAVLVKKHGFLDRTASLSLVCPKEKLLVPKSQLKESEEGHGAYTIDVNEVQFRLSLIAPKEQSMAPRRLAATNFALYRSGLYDMESIKKLPWKDYRPFVLKLFGVRDHPHERYGFLLDGYIGVDSALIWNYPDYKTSTLDYGYVDDLHRVLRGKPGERFYVIAPVGAMSFAEDEVARDETVYVFLKVPISVLLRLLQNNLPAALVQPAKADDVNDVIDAVGYDFISQPKVVLKAKKQGRSGELFPEYLLEISEFRAQTLATDPEDFRNFETFSMAMVDLSYDGDVFQLSRVFWGDDLVKEAGGLDKAERLEIRIAEQEFTGDELMVILCDRYGNEKVLRFNKSEFATRGVSTVRKKLKHPSRAQ